MTGARRSVFVGVDGHTGCRDAVVFAAALAPVLGDELVLGHIHQFDVLGDSLALGTPHDSTIERMAAGIVGRAGQDSPMPFRRVAAAHHSTVGGLHTEAARAGAELLVVGSSHRGAFGRVTLGSHSERVLHGAPCAVAVVPRGVADSGWALRRITVGYDESDGARHAVGVARRLAAAAGATLTLTGVVDPAPGSRERFVHRRGRRAAEQALRETCGDGEAVDLRSGAVAEQLLVAARDTDLLVLGSRDHGPLRRVVVGSTGHSVVRFAVCPVVVVPRAAAQAMAAPAGGW